MAESQSLIRFTADIVAAHVSHNAVPADQLPELIRRVHDALGAVSNPTVLTSEPAIPVKQSVRSDKITCLFCGDKSFKTLKRHLGASHGMTPQQYRTHWRLPANYPMTAPAYTKRRSSLAKEIGLGKFRKTSRRRRA